MAYHSRVNDRRPDDERITIVGGGSFGTSLGKLLGESGRRVTLWVYEPELAQVVNEQRENTMFLPGHQLPKSLVATSSLAEALDGARLVFSVTPAQVARQVWQRAREHLADDAAIVSASKGVEVDSAKVMSEVFDETVSGAPDRTAYLSGPSFAKEIAAGHPTAVVIASLNAELAERAQVLVSTPAFRAYTTDDVIGVELGGALKNVIAIAVGAAEGMGLGLNSRAALMTRGLAEVSRLAVAAGANPLTLAGLAGVGDLMLTCTGHLSRNLQVGIRLGQGESLAQILEGMKMVAEGVETSRSALALARRHGVEMPISAVVVGMLDGAITPAEALAGLMSRKLRSEREL
jgi:glycerol-3-phosphate dehydrogenase (NAD(P)+)